MQRGKKTNWLTVLHLSVDIIIHSCQQNQLYFVISAIFYTQGGSKKDHFKSI